MKIALALLSTPTLAVAISLVLAGTAAAQPATPLTPGVSPTVRSDSSEDGADHAQLRTDRERMKADRARLKADRDAGNDDAIRADQDSLRVDMAAWKSDRARASEAAGAESLKR